MKKKKIIITGINGQDGAYLANLLFKKNKNYKIYGILRRTANYKLDRLNFFGVTNNLTLLYCDVCEYSYISNIITKIKPDFIFNLAAQSFVDYSFLNPRSTFDINTSAVFNILETIKKNKLDTKFYQASSSEMFGNSKVLKQNEKTQFLPLSPYAVSKVLAHKMTNTYRKTFNMFAVSGILFNHESPYRGSEFVTKKIVSSLHRIKSGSKEILQLGNLDSMRDWGYAKDYVYAIYKMINATKPNDYVVATGKSTSVRDFFLKVCNQLNIKVEKKFIKNKEVYYKKKSNQIIMETNKKYFRDNELHYLCGDSSQIKKKLKWLPKTNIDSLIKMMIDFEIKKSR